MVAEKRTAAQRNNGKNSSKNGHNVLLELEGIASRIRELIGRLEAVVEQMVGDRELALSAAQPSPAGGPEQNGGPEGATSDGGSVEPRGEQTPVLENPGETQNAGGEQTVAGQIQEVIQQLQNAPGGIATGELSATIAEQIRSIIEQIERQQDVSNGARQSAAPAEAQEERQQL